MYHYQPKEKTKLSWVLNKLEDEYNELKDKTNHASSLIAYNAYRNRLINKETELQTIKKYYYEARTMPTD